MIGYQHAGTVVENNTVRVVLLQDVMDSIFAFDPSYNDRDNKQLELFEKPGEYGGFFGSI